MIELFEQDIKTNDRQSSKGNQLKWKKNNTWYKADYSGYEGLSEFVVSELLKLSSLKKSEYVSYNPIEISYKSNIFNGVASDNFLRDGWQIVTLEKLFLNYYGKSLNTALWTISQTEERLKFLVQNVEMITGLREFGKYMNKILTIDMLFLNEDRHTHNLAVLMNEKQEFDYCPIFDNGASLLADTKMDYPMNMNVYNLMPTVKAKTFSTDFLEQAEISEMLYHNNITFYFTNNDVSNILSSTKANIYPIEVRNRVQTIIFEQMRKYSYLFSKR